jgi:hypothetical protein
MRSGDVYNRITPLYNPTGQFTYSGNVFSVAPPERTDRILAAGTAGNVVTASGDHYGWGGLRWQFLFNVFECAGYDRGSEQIAGIATPTPWVLFFTDQGKVFRYDGTCVLWQTLGGPTATHSRTWGNLKTIYR